MSLLTLKRNRTRANSIFFFVLAVCLSSVFKNLSYLFKQSFSKLQVMTKSHSFLALGDCAVFFRTWLLCYVILLLTLVRRFSVLGAHAVFFALGARAMFSHAWRSSFVSCTWRSVEFSCAWRPCCALTHLTSTLCTCSYCVHHKM